MYQRDDSLTPLHTALLRIIQEAETRQNVNGGDGLFALGEADGWKAASKSRLAST